MRVINKASNMPECAKQRQEELSAQNLGFLKMLLSIIIAKKVTLLLHSNFMYTLSMYKGLMY